MISYPVSLPTTKSLASIRLIQRTQSAFYRSPFDGSMQVQANQGEWWEAQVQFPPMKRSVAEDFLAVLMALRGPQGVIYLGDTNGKTARGAASGTILVNGANQTGRILLVDGCTPSTVVWKKGDYIQYGAGFKATRIQTSGGSSAAKFATPALTTSVGASGILYRTSIRVKNVGSKTATFIAYGGGTTVAVAAGQETKVELIQTGDGSTALGFQVNAPASGDVLDLVMWDPVTRKYGVYENLLPLANRKFSGWVQYSGSTTTLTQFISQRLHKVMEDVTSDSSGNAEIPLFPTLRHSPFDNEPVISSNCKGVFRLATPQFDFNIDSDLAYGFSAQLVEAL